MFLILFLACTESQIHKLDPELALSSDSLDFEEVVVGTQRTGTLTLSNKGGGVLHLDDVSLDGSSDFELAEQLPDSLDPHDDMPVSVRYAPGAIGPDTGAVLLVTDDPTSPTLSLDLLGEGVEPSIDIDPTSIWFGTVTPGDSKTRSVDINARGQGSLVISDVGLVDDAAEAFSFALPDGTELPLTMEAGTGISVDVTFAPTDTQPWDAQLYIVSNDPDDGDARVRLIGNSDGSGEEAPDVSITWPDWGNQLVSGQSITLQGVVVDDATAPEDLVALWYANDTLLGSSPPDADGNVSLSTADLPTGDVTIRLAALDTDGQLGEDEVGVSVYDTREPTPYILTGGTSVWDYWSVDDDVVITLDDEEIFRDSNDTQDSFAPVSFEATAGQTLRIVATDVNACDQALDALYLHWGTGSSQGLNPVWCRSSCPTHPCFDPDFDGPWPSVFLDLSYVISIP